MALPLPSVSSVPAAWDALVARSASVDAARMVALRWAQAWARTGQPALADAWMDALSA